MGPMPRRPPLLPLLLLLLCCAAASPCAEPGVVVLSFPSEVRVWERFESRAFVPLDGGGNPYDPARVEVWGEFRAPDGGVHETPAFHTREFARSLVGGFERRAATSGPHFALRFSPGQEGPWSWRWQVRTPEGTAASAWYGFTATAPAPDRHGTLRVSALDPRYLRFEDGTPYFAVGENLGWYDGRGTFAYDDWLAKLAEAGVNYVRLWMPSWAFGIEWERLGDYEGRLDRAWQLDRVLEAAEAHGIQVMLCIQNHGPFSLDTNSQWADNPYNAANGGPLADPEAFFTDPEARELFRRRLRYVVARWGAFRNLLAWELWNEIEFVADPNGAEVQAWHREMGQALRALDPYDHLVTSSVSLGHEDTTLWQLPELDFTQNHTYNWPLLLPHANLLHDLNLRARVPGKPSLIGEMGADYRGPAETLATDPSHIAIHDGLWIGVVTGNLGTGMTWWWDNLVDPLDLYPHFAAVAAFVEGVAFDAHGFAEEKPPAVAPGRTLDAWALRGEALVLAWVKNRAHHFAPAGNPGDPTPVEDGVLTLSGLSDGSWTARWFDTRAGAWTASAPVAVAAGTAALEVPAFVGDVALRLEADD